MEEIEVKFLNVNIGELEKKLIGLGAVKEYDKIFKRKIFDYPDLRLDDIGAFVRLRDEGSRIALTYKRRLGMAENGANDEGMEEIETTVDSFSNTSLFLEKIGLTEKLNEEQRRIHYTLHGISLDIDVWPLLNPYLEIESQSWVEINQAIEMLGLNPEDKKIFTTMQVYELQGIDELEFKKLTFEEQVKR